MAWSHRLYHFLRGPFPRVQARKEPPCGEEARLSSRFPVPGGSWVPAAAGGTICAAQVCPPPCPTWGLRTLGRLWPPRARRAAAPGLPSACAGPRGKAGVRVAARGGAARTHPRQAPFKRCQGLIDEKWPRAGANLSPEAAGAGRGWLLSGSAAVEGSLPRRPPRGFPAWRWVRVERENER